MKRLALLVAVSISLAGCEYIPGTEAHTRVTAINKAQQAVSALMKDPTSTMFTEVRVTPHGDTCGYVNAKNSYGAYDGRQGFVVTKSGSASVEKPAASGNVGIDVTNACHFKAQYAACMKGESATEAYIAHTMACGKEGQDAIKDHFKKQAELLRLGIVQY